MAYGNIAIKQAYDIDVLVTPDAVVRACAVLDAAGYRRTFPTANVTPERFATWTEFSKECVFQHDGSHGVIVELHWRLADNPTVLQGVTAGSASRSVVVSPGRALRTLGDEDLFAYLCFHGAQHAWSRLKWLADLAAWLALKPLEEVERLCRTAKAAGTGRAPDQALLLCEELFGSLLPPSLAAGMRGIAPIAGWSRSRSAPWAGGGATRQTCRTGRSATSKYSCHTSCWRRAFGGNCTTKRRSAAWTSTSVALRATTVLPLSGAARAVLDLASRPASGGSGPGQLTGSRCLKVSECGSSSAGRLAWTRDAVAQRQALSPVRDHDDRQARPDRDETFQQCAFALDVDGVGRLVHHQQFRLARIRARAKAIR